MTDEYTPTTGQVRAVFAQEHKDAGGDRWGGEVLFNRWLASVVRDAKAEAWEEGWRGHEHQVATRAWEPNPYRQTEG